MSSTHIHVRVDADMKKKAQAIFAEMGLDVTTAINMFIMQVVRTRTFPFLPSATPFYGENNIADDVNVDEAASRILNKHMKAFEELAK